MIDAAVVEHVRSHAIQRPLADERGPARKLALGRPLEAMLVAGEQFMPQLLHVPEYATFQQSERQRFVRQFLDLLGLYEIDRIAQCFEQLQTLGGRQVEAVQFVQLVEQPRLRRRDVDQRQFGQPCGTGGAFDERRLGVGGYIRQVEFVHVGHRARSQCKKGYPLYLSTVELICKMRESGWERKGPTPSPVPHVPGSKGRIGNSATAPCTS